MTTSKRLKESHEREMRRRDWAALQNPELVTTQQALEMFNRDSYPGFSDFMKNHDVIPVRAAGFFSANFYIKSEVEELVSLGVMNISTKKRGRPVGSVNFAGSRVTFDSMQDGSWTKEQFMQAWGATECSQQAESILDRSTSFFMLAPKDAYHLMLLLLRIGGREYRLPGSKIDRKFYINYIREVTLDESERHKLRDIIYALYNSTDIGVFGPKIIVNILYELMKSRPD